MRGGKKIPTGNHVRFYDLGSFELMHGKLTNWTGKCCMKVVKLPLIQLPFNLFLRTIEI